MVRHIQPRLLFLIYQCQNLFLDNGCPLLPQISDRQDQVLYFRDSQYYAKKLCRDRLRDILTQVPLYENRKEFTLRHEAATPRQMFFHPFSSCFRHHLLIHTRTERFISSINSESHFRIRIAGTSLSKSPLCPSREANIERSVSSFAV